MSMSVIEIARPSSNVQKRVCRGDAMRDRSSRLLTSLQFLHSFAEKPGEKFSFFFIF